MKRNNFDETTKHINHKGVDYAVEFTCYRDGSYPFEKTSLGIRIVGINVGAQMVPIEDAKDINKIKQHILKMLPEHNELNLIKKWDGKL